MEFLGIGPLELVLILILALIILGPRDMQKAGKKIAQGLVKIVKSDTWKTVSQTSQKLKTLPNELMREAGMDEFKKTIAPMNDELKKLNQAGRTMTDNQMNGPWMSASDREKKEPPTPVEQEKTTLPAKNTEKPAS